MKNEKKKEGKTEESLEKNNSFDRLHILCLLNICIHMYSAKK